ncbi:MAG TPA: hypothetical protein VGQ18_10525 [Gemmatimonadales bacterium]|jgi:hypothetical protein|nr:hypothetical protein [Gemmatimonadales bacterium]
MSRLPEDPRYWERLTDRVVTNAGSRLREYRNATSRPWQGLARLSIPLTTGAAAALIVALLWLPQRDRNVPERASAVTVYGLTPADPLAALFITAAAPPTMATLLATLTLERTP